MMKSFFSFLFIALLPPLLLGAETNFFESPATKFQPSAKHETKFMLQKPFQPEPLLPSSLLIFGDPESTVLVVDKSVCQLTVYSFQKQLWHEVRKFKCTTGKGNGDKYKEGDLKTPTGIYRLTNAWTGDELLNKYGSIAKAYGSGSV